MVSISNGSEGLEFEERWCERCVHGDGARDEGEACPIIIAHLLHSGDPAISHFLTRDESGNLGCSMFIERPGQAPWDQP